MPAYNVADYISEAIESILNQTYRNYELIVINDGSTDETVSMIEKYLLDDRIKLYNQKNKGLSSSRNKGLQKALGEYVLFIDSDDLIDQNALENLNKYLLIKSFPDVLAFTARSFDDGNTLEFNKNDDYYRRPGFPEDLLSGYEYYELANLRRQFIASACLMTYKRQSLIKYNLMFRQGIIHEDELFTRQLLLSNTYISFVDLPIYFRRNRIGSISKNDDSPLRVLSYLIIACELVRLEKRHDNALLRKDVIVFWKRAKSIIRANIIYLMDFQIASMILRYKILTFLRGVYSVNY